MNRGSALKWIELLLAEKDSLNDGYGLRWEDGSMSPVGVLENFITREWFISVGCYNNNDGKIMTASEECLKKVKAKTNLEVVDDLWYKVRDRKQLCFLIEFNQETL